MARDPRLKKAFTKEEFTPEMLIEIQKCIQDPIYFITNYVYILHPKRGRIRFELYDFQKDMIRAYQNNRWVISKVGRQSGKTETSAAFLTWYTLFNKDKTVLVCANRLTNAREIIDRISGIYAELPAWLKPGIDETEFNKTTLAFENGSKIVAQATSINTGRGLSISLLYWDECAHISVPGLDRNVWASLQPTLSTGGAAIITSTPKGSTNLFAELWRASTVNIKSEDGTGANGFYHIDVDWTMVPGRDEKFKEEQISKLGLRAWQEEFECKFLSSDRAVIDTLKLEYAERTVRSIEDTIGELYNQDFWKLPNKNGTYIIGVDPAEGTGRDYSVIEAFEFPSMEQIMEYRSNDQSPTNLYSILKTVIKFFERNSLMTYFSVESNNIGQAIISLYETDEKPPIKAVFVSEEDSDKLGMRTTNPAKMKALISFKEMFERGNIKLNSKELINELKYLVRKDNTFKAQEGYTDDCVMAVMICIRIMQQMADYDSRAYQKLYDFNQVVVDPWQTENESNEMNWEDDLLPFIVG